MDIVLDGNPNVYRCEDGAPLGEVLDYVRRHLGLNHRAIVRVLLDGQEMPLENEAEYRRSLVNEWRTCAVHSAPVGTLAGSLLYSLHSAAEQLLAGADRALNPPDDFASDDDVFSLTGLLLTELAVAGRLLGELQDLQRHEPRLIPDREHRLVDAERELPALLQEMERLQTQRDPGLPRYLKRHLEPWLQRVKTFCQEVPGVVPLPPSPTEGSALPHAAS